MNNYMTPPVPFTHEQNKQNDPFYIDNVLLLRPPIEAVDRTQLSIQAFLAAPSLGSRLLWLAVEAGHTSTVAALLRAGANPVGINHDAYPSSGALLAASEQGDLESVRMLVEAGADPDLHLRGVQDVDCDVSFKHWDFNTNTNANIGSGWSFSTTPLFLAIEGGHVEVVRFLLGTGRVDLTRRVEYWPSDHTALEMAALVGDLPTFAALMEHLNITGSGGDESPFFQVTNLLTSAGWSRNLEVVNYALLRLGFPAASPWAGRRGSLLTNEHRKWVEIVLRGLCGGVTRPKSIGPIEHFLDYLREPGQLTIPELPDLRHSLLEGMHMAIVHGQTDVFALLARLFARLMHQEKDDSSYDEGENQKLKCSMYSALYREPEEKQWRHLDGNAAKFESVLQARLVNAIDWDRDGIVQFLVEVMGIDPNENTKGLDSVRQDYQERPLSILERAVVDGAHDVAAYLIEHTDPYIMGYLHRYGHWTTPLAEVISGSFSTKHYRKNLVSAEDVARLLLSKGGPVSSISPPTTPNFGNGNTVVVDVVETWGRETCLCWGYKDTIRPKPWIQGKTILRLKLKEQDEAWWNRLRKRPGMPP